MKKLLLIFLSLTSLSIQAQQTLINLDGWNCYVHLPADYNQNNNTYTTLIFFPGAGEIGTNASALIAHGPGAYLKSGWDGSALGVDFIIASIQPTVAYPAASAVKAKVDLFKNLYRTSDIWLTGLSRGAWNSFQLSYTYLNDYAGVLAIEPQATWLHFSDHPDTYDYYSEDIVRTFKPVGESGQRYFIYHNDGGISRSDEIANAVNQGRPDAAIWAHRTLGGTGHTGWDYVYGTSTREPYVFEELGNKNIYDWLASVVLSIVPNFITDFFKRGDQLFWRCENTEDGDYFLLEESTDGASFTEIGRVSAFNSIIDYSYQL